MSEADILHLVAQHNDKAALACGAIRTVAELENPPEYRCAGCVAGKLHTLQLYGTVE